MFIGNRIKPKHKPTRTVRFLGKDYVFADIHRDGHFVTEVTDADHAERMLALPSQFYAYPEGKPQLTRGTDPAEAERLAAIEREAREREEAARAAAEAAAREAAEKAAREAANTELAQKLADVPREVIVEAQKLLEVEPGKFAAAVSKLPADTSVAIMRAALVLEQGSAKPRPKVEKHLGDALKMLEQANG